MATINENNQSYLELQGMEARTKQTALNDYVNNNEYSEQHSDALGDGDGRGKGTGNFGGYGWSVPDLTKPKNQIDYSNFNTTSGGNDCDVQSRKVMTSRALYNADNQYGVDIVPDTSLNVSDGQFDGSARAKIAYVCPVV